MTTVKKLLGHAAGAVLEGALVAILITGLIVGTALAAKGGNASTTSGGLALVMVTDANGDGQPNHGDVVTFDVSTTATTQPFVNVQCDQSGTQVLNSWNGFFAGSFNTNDNFGLSSATWQSGAADCTASLEMYAKHGWRKLGSLSFHVNG